VSFERHGEDKGSDMDSMSVGKPVIYFDKQNHSGDQGREGKLVDMVGLKFRG
jgi:hypothetical protein